MCLYVQKVFIVAHSPNNKSSGKRNYFLIISQKWLMYEDNKQ